MPIYEFYCRHCHRVFNFLSRAVNTDKTPACPRCASAEMTRRASAFAISKGRKEEPKPEKPPGPDIDEARLERAMEAMAGEMDSIDENDPKQGARLMRKLFSATGMPVGSGMEEALRRMEAGEDPEKIEEQMGDVFEEDPFGGLLGGEAAGGEGAAGEPDGGKRKLGSLRRLLPPSHDPELHELT
jgi:putative FmdB family regulatory protein